MSEASEKLAIACGGTPDDIERNVEAEALKQEFRNNLQKVYVLKAKYDEMSEEQIKSIEAKKFILVPVEEDELDGLNRNTAPYTNPMMLNKHTELPILEPCFLYRRARSGKTPKIKPKDYVKNRKKKQRLQKQSRKKNK